ncbi:hypothetical protein [Marinicellulosiphila megalodicopiae]|uniref:hypothetical protein n=1 Tax=Marinicellulosiphila megalodicopiae TaxID=2724896 RepID=UPI003BAE7C12
MNILILGATGLVGNDCLEILINKPSIKNVICPTRKPLHPHEKLTNPDFNTWLNDIEHNPKLLNTIDAVICCLGTTIKLAKTKEQFKFIDHTLVLKIATICKQANISIFAYNSSLGANINSKQLYVQTKGLVEFDLTQLDFNYLSIVRPSLLVGKSRPEFRFGEWLAIHFTLLCNPLLPKKYQSIKTMTVAKALCHLVMTPSKKVVILESDNLQNFL